jgi:hypothetical protein
VRVTYTYPPRHILRFGSPICTSTVGDSLATAKWSTLEHKNWQGKIKMVKRDGQDRGNKKI